VLAGVDDSPISCIAADHAAIEADLHGPECGVLLAGAEGRAGS
jgi:hypothetical protein